MRTSYAASLVRRVPLHQYSFRELEQERSAAREYKTALLAPYYEAAYGSKVSSAELVTLVKHVASAQNKVAETTMKLAFGAKHLGFDRAACVRPFAIAQSIISAQFPLDEPLDYENLSALETEIESAMNPIQWRARGDQSHATLTRLLEKVNESIAILERLKTWLEQRLYGGRTQ